MKKIVLNISENTYEKFRFEAIDQKKSVQDIVTERLFFKPFSEDVEKALSDLIESELEKILGES